MPGPAVVAGLNMAALRSVEPAPHGAAALPGPDHRGWRRCTRPLRPRRPGVLPSGWSFTTPLSLPKGRQLAESCPELVEGMAEIEFSAILWLPRLR